ncbi:MAG: hypothetical protein WDO24_04245 [Pseudomonadota bacterium]
MTDEATEARPRSKPTPSPEIKALDTEIRTRFARRTDALESFLNQWLKLDESQAMFFAARGTLGENYLQYLLSAADMPMALGVARMCSGFAGTTDSERIVAFLNNIDPRRQRHVALPGRQSDRARGRGLARDRQAADPARDRLLPQERQGREPAGAPPDPRGQVAVGQQHAARQDPDPPRDRDLVSGARLERPPSCAARS